MDTVSWHKSGFVSILASNQVIDTLHHYYKLWSKGRDWGLFVTGLVSLYFQGGVREDPEYKVPSNPGFRGCVRGCLF